MSDDMNFKEDNLMISAGDFRNGITVEIAVSYTHLTLPTNSLV